MLPSARLSCLALLLYYVLVRPISVNKDVCVIQEMDVVLEDVELGAVVTWT